MSMFSDNAAEFATRADDRITQERRAGITAALSQLVQGRPGRAYYEIVRSVERQATLAGIRDITIPTTSGGAR